jgi:hypothetical protein
MSMRGMPQLENGGKNAPGHPQIQVESPFEIRAVDKHGVLNGTGRYQQDFAGHASDGSGDR